MWNQIRRAVGAGREHKSVLRELVALQGLDARRVGRPNYAKLASVGYAQNAIAFRCVRMVAEAASSVPLTVRRNGVEAGPNDPALKLFAAPNPDQSLTELLEIVLGHLQIAGNGYLELIDLDGEARELYALRPDRLKVAKGKRGWPTGWEYAVGDRVKRYLRDPATGRSNLMHLRIFNPGDDHYGFAPMEAAHGAVETHNAAGSWNRALLENAARPSGALVFRGVGGADRMTEDQFDRLKAELLEAHTGAAAAGRRQLVEGGLEWRPFGLSPAEMDYAAAKNTAAREIALAFGVPPMLLAIPGDNTYANYKEANLALWRLTVLPLARKTASALERWLKPWLGDDLQIRCSVDDLPAFSDERAQLWRALADAPFMTQAERRRTAGLPETPNRSEQ